MGGVIDRDIVFIISRVIDNQIKTKKFAFANQWIDQQLSKNFFF
jgi:hypothetical protein